MSFFSDYGARLAEWWTSMSATDLVWLGIGLGGQCLFVLRWLIQWLASEKARRLVVPEAFWYASLIGGLMVLAYGLYKPDPVIVLGQFGVFIYARNVFFIWRQRRDGAPAAGAEQPPAAGGTAA